MRVAGPEGQDSTGPRGLRALAPASLGLMRGATFLGVTLLDRRRAERRGESEKGCEGMVGEVALTVRLRFKGQNQQTTPRPLRLGLDPFGLAQEEARSNSSSVRRKRAEQKTKAKKLRARLASPMARQSLWAPSRYLTVSAKVYRKPSRSVSESFSRGLTRSKQNLRRDVCSSAPK
jgi:hypothetical protein